MIKNGLCVLVIAAASLFPTQVEDCKPPKKSLESYEMVIKQISTVEQAEEYILTQLKYLSDWENYGKDNYVASFKVIHERKRDDCDGGALAAAALLSDDGYAPLMLIMSGKKSAHAIFIYKENGLIGCLGINKTDCIRPKFRSLEEVTINFGFDNYSLINLDNVSPNWKDCNYDLSELIGASIRFRKIQ